MSPYSADWKEEKDMALHNKGRIFNVRVRDNSISNGYRGEYVVRVLVDECMINKYAS